MLHQLIQHVPDQRKISFNALADFAKEFWEKSGIFYHSDEELLEEVKDGVKTLSMVGLITLEQGGEIITINDAEILRRISIAMEADPIIKNIPQLQSLMNKLPISPQKVRERMALQSS